MLLLILLRATPLSAQFLAEDYFPLEPGNEWTYLVDGTQHVTFRIQDELEEVNGIPTFTIAEIGGEFDGSSSNLTNDSNGIERHKSTNRDAINDDVTIVLSPPQKLLTAVFGIGDVIQSSGRADTTVGNFGTFVLSYESTSTVVGTERVTVPFGTFDTIRVDNSVRIFGQLPGGFFDVTEKSSDWAALGIGPVKSTLEGPTSELETTNVPEPSLGLLYSTAMISTLAIRRTRQLAANDRVVEPLSIPLGASAVA